MSAPGRTEGADGLSMSGHPASGLAAARAALLAVVGLLLTLPAAAVERPLWELGLGVAGLRLPHYRGSDQSYNWLLPVPYAVYRGDIFKADREGARAVLLDTPQVNVDLSVSAGVPTRSDGNDARRGMDDLAPTLELGPNLVWTAARGSGWKLDLRAPVRAVLTLESSPRWIGVGATPNINLDLTQVLPGWNLGLQAGPLFGSRRLHGHFYDVDANDVAPGRPRYSAPGGFAGAQAVAALSRRFQNHWVGMFVRWDSLRGAAFADSPLVRDRQQLSAGVALAWVLAASSRQVPAPD
jgi:MipA family protein